MSYALKDDPLWAIWGMLHHALPSAVVAQCAFERSDKIKIQMLRPYIYLKVGDVTIHEDINVFPSPELVTKLRLLL